MIKKKIKTKKIIKKPPMPPAKASAPNHKQRFEQLLDDAVLGVKRK